MAAQKDPPSFAQVTAFIGIFWKSGLYSEYSESQETQKLTSNFMDLSQDKSSLNSGVG